jgi:hypothetical protein
MKDEPVIVFSRNGETTVIKGWRARLLILCLSLAAAVLFVLLTFLLLGVAITFATLLVFGIPLAIAVAILVEWVQSIRRPP